MVLGRFLDDVQGTSLAPIPRPKTAIVCGVDQTWSGSQPWSSRP